jgi:hypothetical protein
MMVLSGAMFSFDKLNRSIGSIDKVPIIAEIMPTRWTYEALMVTQFKDNRYNRYSDSRYGKTVYEYKKNQSIADFYTVKLLPALENALERTDSVYRTIQSEKEDPGKAPKIDNLKTGADLSLIRNELERLFKRFPTLGPFKNIAELTPDKYNETVYSNLRKYLGFVENNFTLFENKVNDDWDEFYLANKSDIRKLENSYSNLKLQEIVTKFYERDKNKLLQYKNSLVQNYDPVYLEPPERGFLAFRTHFFSPGKYFFGTLTDTFYFNIGLVLFSTVALFLTLYFEILGKVVGFFENLKFRK